MCAWHTQVPSNIILSYRKSAVTSAIGLLSLVKDILDWFLYVYTFLLYSTVNWVYKFLLKQTLGPTQWIQGSMRSVEHEQYFDFFFIFIFLISWRLITLQYCSGFCHTLKWISHGFTCVPHPDPPSHLPLHPIPLGLPSAPGPSTCLMHPTWAGDLFHPGSYTCFDMLSQNIPPSPSPRIQNSVLYICVSFSVLHIGLSLPSV